jgi:hypothetical protein
MALYLVSSIESCEKRVNLGPSKGEMLSLGRLESRTLVREGFESVL